MADSKNIDVPELGFWEKADLTLAQLTIATNALMAALTGAFRGQASPKKYSHHVMAAAIRRMCDRTSDRQRQYVSRISGERTWRSSIKMERTENMGS